MESLLLQATTSAGGSAVGNIVLIVLMIVVFYFFMIRPQQKKQKEIQKFQESVKEGTSVVTSGGIHGKIKDVKENYFIVTIANGVDIKVEKNAVFAAGNDATVVAK